MNYELIEKMSTAQFIEYYNGTTHKSTVFEIEMIRRLKGLAAIEERHKAKEKTHG